MHFLSNWSFGHASGPFPNSHELQGSAFIVNSHSEHALTWRPYDFVVWNKNSEKSQINFPCECLSDRTRNVKFNPDRIPHCKYCPNGVVYEGACTCDMISESIRNSMYFVSNPTDHPCTIWFFHVWWEDGALHSSFCSHRKQIIIIIGVVYLNRHECVQWQWQS